MEYKSAALYASSIVGRTVTGYAAVFGNVDAGGDVVHPGAFRKTLAEGMKRVRHLWNHAAYDPPTAVIKSMVEVGREQLPADLLRDFPDATGALVVTREYLDTPRGNEVLAGIKSGAITEMSFGYEPVKADYSQVRNQRVRNLRELRLYETSDVLWGMNDATRAAKSPHGRTLTPDELAATQSRLRLSQIRARLARLDAERDQRPLTPAEIAAVESRLRVVQTTVALSRLRGR